MGRSVAQQLIESHLVTGTDPADYGRIGQGDTLQLARWREELPSGSVHADDLSQGFSFELRHHLSPRQVELVLAGGQLARLRNAADGG